MHFASLFFMSDHLCKFLTISLTALIDKNAIVIIDKGNADLHNIGVFL
jgi:hypothetical protein